MMRKTLALCAVALLAALVLAAGVTVCPKCGWEVPEGAERCTHCEQAPPPADKAPPPADPSGGANPADPRDALAGKGVEILRAGAQRMQQERDALGAWLLIRTGLPLARASGRIEAAKLDQAARMERAAGKAMMTGTQTCPVCKGSGKGVQQFISMSGERKVQPVPGLDCSACRGTGTVRQERSLDELERLMTGPRLELEQSLKERGLVQVSGVWVPGETTNALGVLLTVEILKASASDCPECYGLGGGGCRSCKGAGVRACDASSCDRGMILCPDCQGRRDSGSSSGRLRGGSQTCRTCNQKGLLRCDGCGGRGLVACEECSGTGRESCAACGGTALRPECRACSGRGVDECSRCRGTGEYRNGICPECLGEKWRLCSTCGGTGRGRSRR